jgi:hypothetical protein
MSFLDVDCLILLFHYRNGGIAGNIGPLDEAGVSVHAHVYRSAVAFPVGHPFLAGLGSKWATGQCLRSCNHLSTCGSCIL